MTFATWAEFYRSDVQSVYALWLVPFAFLVYWLLSRPSGARSVEPRATRFLNVYAPLFAIETIVDPFATGPLLRWLDIEGPLATYCMLPFVLVGDFRVYLLIFFFLAPERGVWQAILRAGAWTVVVPLLALGGNFLLEDYFHRLPSQTIWIVYELSFVVVASWLRFRLFPASSAPRRFELHQYLRALVHYVIVYYALWAAADLLIVVGGMDAGWALRVIPNQLYYSLWIPYAYGSFFSPRYAARSSPVHASR